MVKKSFLVLLLVLASLLGGCADNRINVKIIKGDSSEAGAEIYTEVAEIESNSELAQSVNVEMAEGIREETVKFLERAAASETADDKLKITQTVAFAENGVVSIIIDGEEYTGGAHGELKRKVKNLDLDAGCEIGFADVFTDDSYRDRINAYIEQEMSEKPNKYADLWKRPLVGGEQEFYIAKTGIVIYYPPYELSYYSRGFVEFEIPYEELTGYLKPEYAAKLIEK